MILLRVKVYKTHITKWGIDKRLKEVDARTMICQYSDRMEHGKASAFRVRGREVDYFSAVHHFEKKHVSIDNVIIQRARFKTSNAVRCFTPVPSSLRIPESLVLPERLFIVLRDYHKRCTEPKWTKRYRPHLSCKDSKGLGNPVLRLWIFSIKCQQAC